ncbi:hypothetical protein NDU88_008862 [Pleurodeles waltl]|uniref:Uncharacterized protein n=1 Tax=Pleurodeles waltl TaxID=8319 RepID=A0AAV7PU64_PLEWA|nr:hypothetical protein NDU88_008862 [Pleurodeles waltl]
MAAASALSNHRTWTIFDGRDPPCECLDGGTTALRAAPACEGLSGPSGTRATPSGGPGRRVHGPARSAPGAWAWW